MFRGGGGATFKGRRGSASGDLEHGGAWRPRAPAGGGAPLGSPGARRSSPSVSGPGAPRLSSAYRPSTAYSSLTSSLEPSPHDLLQGGRPHEATSWGEGSCPALACRWGHSFQPTLATPYHRLPYSAGGPRGALRYGDDALPASLTPSSCRLHPGASPPAPLVCPAGAPPGISGIRVRAARATRHAPRPAFKSLAVDGPVAYPTVSHKLYTPCPNGRRDVVNRLSHAGVGLVPFGGAIGGPGAASGGIPLGDSTTDSWVLCRRPTAASERPVSSRSTSGATPRRSSRSRMPSWMSAATMDATAWQGPQPQSAAWAPGCHWDTSANALTLPKVQPIS